MEGCVEDLGPREVLLAVEEVRERRMRAEAELLVLAAHWCDLHGEVCYDPQRRACPGGEVLVGLGGPGTPEVEEFAAAEFGAMNHQHPMAARHLMADALDLRHRLPRTWRAVHDLRLEVWLARKIASMTRVLDLAPAMFVDAAIQDALDALPPGRLLALVKAKVLEADPLRAESAARESAQTRFVRTTRDVDGLSTLIARAATGDVLVFEAMVDRIAEVMADQSPQPPESPESPESSESSESRQVRRARAIGVLARPADALQLLLTASRRAGVPDEEFDAEVDPDGAIAATLTSTLTSAATSLDPAHTRPPVRLFVHLAQEALTREGCVARIEGHGPILATQLREWLVESGTPLLVTPVLDLADQRPVDGYEHPARIVEALHQLTPTDAFPWAVNTGRRRDTDHPDPYVPLDRGGPPGQTGLHNGARLTRHHHRIKTHSAWKLIQPGPGIYLWRSPHGFWFRVDHTGTHRADHGGPIWLKEPDRVKSA